MKWFKRNKQPEPESMWLWERLTTDTATVVDRWLVGVRSDSVCEITVTAHVSTSSVYEAVVDLRYRTDLSCGSEGSVAATDYETAVSLLPEPDLAPWWVVTLKSGYEHILSVSLTEHRAALDFAAVVRDTPPDRWLQIPTDATGHER